MATLPSGQVIALPTFATTADIVTSLQKAIQALASIITNFNQGGVTETYLEGCALALGSDASTYAGVIVPGAYELLATVQSAAFVLTAVGDALDLKAADVGVFRKPAVAATGSYVFAPITPSNSAILVSAGALVGSNPADPTAPLSLYVTQADAIIPAGASQSNVVTVVAVLAGSSGNAVPGSATSIVSGASNVTGTNPQSISGGADTEQDDFPNGGLRARTLTAIADASQGTIAAIQDDAKTFPGISDAVLVENTADDGITPQDGRGQLYVDDGSGNLGSADNLNNAVIAKAQAAFTSGLYRAAGTQVNVVGSLLLPIVLTLTVDVNRQYAAQVAGALVVGAAARDAVYAYTKTLGIGKPVLLAEIVRFAAEVPGVVNVDVGSVTINGVSADLLPRPMEVARCLDSTSVVCTVALVGY